MIPTEWMQPVRPLRVLFQIQESDLRYHIYILAVRTIDDRCEYLSIDGVLLAAGSKSVMFAETLIDGEWMRLG